MGEALCTYIENDRPFLGICLGLQLLFHSSEENGPGFALLPPSPSTQSALWRFLDPKSPSKQVNFTLDFHAQRKLPFFFLVLLMDTTLHLKTETNGRKGFKACKEGNNFFLHYRSVLSTVLLVFLFTIIAGIFLMIYIYIYIFFFHFSRWLLVLTWGLMIKEIL